MSLVSIAIIGAGLAGLSAATRLKEAGVAVSVFDKSRGTGGRLSSKQTAVGTLDLGTQQFSASHPDFLKQLEQWQQKGWVTPWEPRLYQAGPQGLQPFVDDLVYWTSVPRSSALTRQLLGCLPAHFGCRIEQVQRQAGYWWLHETTGQRHGPYSQVIVATPAPQAVALLSEAPLLSQQAASVPVEAIWALALGFAQPLTAPMDLCWVQEGPLAYFSSDRHRPGRSPLLDIWTLQARGDWTAEHLEEPQETLVAQLSQSFGQWFDQPLPPRAFQLAHRWRYGRSLKPQDWGFLAAPEIGLYACGDWCLGGRIEDAWLSGQHVAQAVLQP